MYDVKNPVCFARFSRYYAEFSKYYVEIPTYYVDFSVCLSGNPTSYAAFPECLSGVSVYPAGNAAYRADFPKTCTLPPQKRRG